MKRLTFLFAFPEKALIDLLYLYPFYDNEREIRELRLDEDVLHEVIDLKRLELFTKQAGKKVIEKRVKIFRKVYGL